jgi:crossover junction endonuclease MUS81
VKLTTKVLALGDICWAAQLKPGYSSAANPDLVILDYIVERKSGGDLHASIIDSRYTEQKYRLQKCGVKNVVYLIEENTETDDKIFSAMVQCQVLDGFILKQTESARDTVGYLYAMTRALQKQYEGMDLHVGGDGLEGLMTLGMFNERNSKRGMYTYNDIFIKQLMCIRGMSAQKAAAVARVYPTLNALMSDIEMKGVEGVEATLKALGTGRNGIGNALSKKMMDVFWSLDYGSA